MSQLISSLDSSLALPQLNHYWSPHALLSLPRPSFTPSSVLFPPHLGYVRFYLIFSHNVFFSPFNFLYPTYCCLPLFLGVSNHLSAVFFPFPSAFSFFPSLHRSCFSLAAWISLSFFSLHLSPGTSVGHVQSYFSSSFSPCLPSFLISLPLSFSSYPVCMSVISCSLSFPGFIPSFCPPFFFLIASNNSFLLLYLSLSFFHCSLSSSLPPPFPLFFFILLPLSFSLSFCIHSVPQITWLDLAVPFLPSPSFLLFLIYPSILSGYWGLSISLFFSSLFSSHPSLLSLALWVTQPDPSLLFSKPQINVDSALSL